MKSTTRKCAPVFSLALAGVVSALTAGEVLADAHEKYEAKFNADGEMIRPAGWREWILRIRCLPGFDHVVLESWQPTHQEMSDLRAFALCI